MAITCVAVSHLASGNRLCLALQHLQVAGLVRQHKPIGVQLDLPAPHARIKLQDLLSLDAIMLVCSEERVELDMRIVVAPTFAVHLSRPLALMCTVATGAVPRNTAVWSLTKHRRACTPTRICGSCMKSLALVPLRWDRHPCCASFLAPHLPVLPIYNAGSACT